MRPKRYWNSVLMAVGSSMEFRSLSEAMEDLCDRCEHRFYNPSKLDVLTMFSCSMGSFVNSVYKK
jgi:hypothetical protein